VNNKNQINFGETFLPLSAGYVIFLHKKSKFQKEESRDLYCLPNISREIKY
jgi:hypothetical protein